MGWDAFPIGSDPVFACAFPLFYYNRKSTNPAIVYLFKVTNKNFRRRCEICWKLTIKTPTSFNKAWTQVLRMFKSCSRCVGDSRWWRSLTMVPAGNKAKRLSSVNHTTKTIHHHDYLSALKLPLIYKIYRFNFFTAMVSCLKFWQITNSSDHRRVCIANPLHPMQLPNPLRHKIY